MEAPIADTAPRAPQALSARLLGPAEVTIGGAPATPSARKGLLLLTYLVHESGRPHARARLAGLLWPEASDADARSSLRQVLSRLRRDLGERDARVPLLHATRTSLRLDLRDGDEVDVLTLHEQVAPGTPLSTEALVALAARIRGPLLQGVDAPEGPLADWLEQARRDVEERAVRVLGDLAEVRLADGALDEVESLALRQLALRANHERAFRQRMRVALAAGRRQDALLLYEQCHDTLIDTLGVRPSEPTRELHRAVVAEVGAASPTPPPARRASESAGMEPTPRGPGRQPPLRRQLGLRAAIVGRERERDALTARIRTGTRLVTLQGPGGMGKTRLAETVALDLEPELRDGVAWVRAATAETPTELAAACLDVLGVETSLASESAALLDALSSAELLLVLDEVELVVRRQAHTELVVQILRRCPGVRVLATSRTRLKLTDEYVHFVEGLGESAPELFRARMHEDVVEPGPDDEACIERICAFVGGVPLTVELAARLTRTLSVADLARQLPEVPELLRADELDVEDRHRSVEAVFQPTWNTLSDETRRAASRCALFDSPFLLEAGHAVAGLTPDLLGELIDASLVRQVSHRRYGLHTFLRQLALSRLVDAEPVSSGWERHARWFVARLLILVDRAYGPVRSPEVPYPQLVLDELAHRTLSDEHADLHRAVRWWLEHTDAEEASPVVVAWWRCLRQRSRWQEAAEHLEVALSRHPAHPDRRVTPPILWTFLQGVTAAGHFANDRVLAHLGRTLGLLGTRTPRRSAAFKARALAGIATLALTREAPMQEGPALTRESILSMSHSLMAIPYVLRRGQDQASYAIISGMTCAWRSPVPEPLRARQTVMAGLVLGMLGLGRRSELLLDRARMQLGGLTDASTRHMIRYSLCSADLLRNVPLSTIDAAFEDVWSDLEPTFRAGLLGEEIVRAALVAIHPWGHLPGLRKWVARGRAASRGGTPAMQIPVRFYDAFVRTFEDAEDAWQRVQQIEEDDAGTARAENNRALMLTGSGRLASRAGHLDQALLRADAGSEIIERHRVGPTMLTPNLAIGPARVYLHAWSVQGGLSRARQRHLRRALSQLASISRTCHSFRAELALLRGLRHHVSGRPDRALAAWRAARDLGDRSEALASSAEATTLLAVLGPGSERPHLLEDARQRYDALGASGELARLTA